MLGGSGNALARDFYEAHGNKLADRACDQVRMNAKGLKLFEGANEGFVFPARCPCSMTSRKKAWRAGADIAAHAWLSNRA